MLTAQTESVVFLVGKWFVFWSVGVRLFVAGVRQGFTNLSMGILGLCSLVRFGWIVPTAVVGGLYYGLAGMGHLHRSEKNTKEYMALIAEES
ncbi:MAG: hypothetical protein ABSF22_17625 [Bryobacteraceae bacterium]